MAKQTTKDSEKATSFFNIGERQPLLPEVKSLSDLFVEAKVWRTGVEHELFKMGALESTGYCQVSVVGSSEHFDSLTIRPSLMLERAVVGSMLKIDHDQIYFEIIVYEDRSSRVYARYSQIIGSRLVADFNTKVTRAFFRNLHTTLGYLVLPRAKKSS